MPGPHPTNLRYTGLDNGHSFHGVKLTLRHQSSTFSHSGNGLRSQRGNRPRTRSRTRSRTRQGTLPVPALAAAALLAVWPGLPFLTAAQAQSGVESRIQANTAAAAVPPAPDSAAVPIPHGDEIADLIVRGDRASKARNPAAALKLYDEALALDSMNFAALWRASRELVDLGEFESDRALQKARYSRAELLARRAMSLKPEVADAHFHVARAVGRTALAAGARDRVKYAMEVRTHALNALRLDPQHAGALHIMGVWNAEVMRLNGMLRSIAIRFMGGGPMKQASWDEALRLMRAAVAQEPDHLVHHLDLARIYHDMGRDADARSEYAAALASPLIEANDDRYRLAAETELRRLR